MSSPRQRSRPHSRHIPAPRHPRLPALAVALGVAALGFAWIAPSPARSAEAAFLQRFEGSFAGRGQVSRSEGERPAGVNCTMRGSATATTVAMNGTCRAAVIFSREIGATLKADDGGRYTGTYIGSTIGPAALSGRRRGDALVLTITWPAEVRGDRTATMTIRNAGDGALALAISDRAGRGGPMETVSSIQLRKR